MNEMMWVQVGFMTIVLVVIAAMFVRQARLVRELERDKRDAAAKARDGAHGLTVLNRPVEPKCTNCAHFDLEEGQAQFRLHRAFTQVTEIVTPAMMSQEAKLDDLGNLIVDNDGVLEKTAPAVPHKTKWSEFGACMKHQEARWEQDVCDEHVPAAGNHGNTAAAG